MGFPIAQRCAAACSTSQLSLCDHTFSYNDPLQIEDCMFLAPFRVNGLLNILVRCTASYGCEDGIALPSKALEVETCRRTSVEGEGRLAKNLAKFLSNAKGWAGG
jgi:hypothetical protein